MVNDLLVPGFPHNINGSLFNKQINSQNKFSLNALFLAYPFFPFNICSVINRLSLSVISSKFKFSMFSISVKYFFLYFLGF